MTKQKAIQTIKDFLELTTPTSLLHVGGHTAEEMGLYAPLQVTWIEPVPEFCNRIKRRVQRFAPHHKVHNVAASSVNADDVPFHITYRKQHRNSPQRGGQSSLLMHTKELDMGLQKVHVTDTIHVPCRRLDDMELGEFDVAVLDTQGTEGDVLQGGLELFSQCYALLIEVSYVDLYHGNCSPEEVVSTCEGLGFQLQQYIPHTRNEQIMKWGDMVFLKP